MGYFKLRNLTEGLLKITFSHVQ